MGAGASDDGGSQGKLREIERLRGVAILLVLWVHADFLYRFTPNALHETWAGVDLFFVISGFVVTLSLAPRLGERESGTFAQALAAARRTLSAFYVRRVYRLLPMAVFVFALQLTLVLSARGTTTTFGSIEGVLGEMLLILSGTYNYAITALPEPHLAIFWSLCVEEHFYLLVPLLFILARTRSRRLRVCIGGIVLVALVVRPLTPELQNYMIGRLRSHLRFDSLLAGVFLALVYPRGVARSPLSLPRMLPRFVVVPVLVVLIAVLPSLMAESLAHRWGLIALWLFSAALIALASRDEDLVLGFPIVGRALEWVGARSYAMYLLHWSLFGMVVELANRTGWEPTTSTRAFGLFVVCVALTCVLSDVAHAWIERPYIAAGRARVLGWVTKEPPGKSPVRLATFAVAAVILGGVAGVWALVLAPRRAGPPVWSAEYFVGPDLRGPAVLREESGVDFYWGRKPPAPEVPEEFSARWKTCLRTDHQSRVELVVGSDDGSRLKVDGVVVIESWRDQGLTFVSAVTTLQPGVHTVELDYYNRRGNASAILRAGFDGARPTAIPSANLRLPHALLGCQTTH